MCIRKNSSDSLFFFFEVLFSRIDMLMRQRLSCAKGNANTVILSRNCYNKRKNSNKEKKKQQQQQR